MRPRQVRVLLDLNLNLFLVRRLLPLGEDPGYLVLQLLQRIVKERHTLPVILCTAFSCYKDDFSAWLADGYVVKSSDMQELKDEIARVLAKRQKKAN